MTPKEFLESLRWDGKPRIATALTDYLGAEPTEDNAIILRKWMIGAVKRAYEPGCTYNLCPVFIGPPGSGKTLFVQRLALAWGHQSDYPYIDTRTGLDRTDGAWIVEITDLMPEINMESFKLFIGRNSDTYRAPCDAQAEKHPRACVYAVTATQLPEHLKGEGVGTTRRFPVVRVGVVPTEKGLSAFFNEDTDYMIEQLWAEAVHLRKYGY